MKEGWARLNLSDGIDLWPFPGGRGGAEEAEGGSHCHCEDASSWHCQWDPGTGQGLGCLCWLLALPPRPLAEPPSLLQHAGDFICTVYLEEKKVETEQHVKVGAVEPGATTNATLRCMRIPKYLLFESWGSVDPARSGFGA